MVGVRLDSGDLAYLSIETRRLLDEAGFHDAIIVASNDLDEHVISSLKEQGAKIAVWGVGTRLITGHDQGALGGVYKLSALREPGGHWRHTLKLSEQMVKISTPGLLQIRRFRDAGRCVADMVYDELTPIDPTTTIVDPMDATQQQVIARGTESEDLLVPIVREGRLQYEVPPLDDIRRRAAKGLESFQAGIRRPLNPHRYPVGLEKNLHQLKTDLVLKARGVK